MVTQEPRTVTFGSTWAVSSVLRSPEGEFGLRAKVGGAAEAWDPHGPWVQAGGTQARLSAVTTNTAGDRSV